MVEWEISWVGDQSRGRKSGTRGHKKKLDAEGAAQKRKELKEMAKGTLFISVEVAKDNANM